MLSLFFFPIEFLFFYRWHSRLSLSFDHFIVCLKWWRLILFLRLPANWEYYFAFIEFFKHFLSVYISHFYSLCLVYFFPMFCSVLRAFLFMLVFFFWVLFCLVFTSHYVFFPYQFIFLSLCCFDQGLRSMLILSQQTSFFSIACHSMFIFR